MGLGPLLICGFGPFPAAPANPSGIVVERLRDAGWTPVDGAAAYAVLPARWDTAPEAALQALASSDASGVLLLGVSVGAAGFQVELLARNHADVLARDAVGGYCPAALIDPDGPATRPVGGPAEAMLEALRSHRITSAASTNAGDYLCNFTLYRLLAGAGVPIAFVHLPQALECAPHSGFVLDEIERGVKVTAEVFARWLAEAKD